MTFGVQGETTHRSKEIKELIGSWFIGNYYTYEISKAFFTRHEPPLDKITHSIGQCTFFDTPRLLKACSDKSALRLSSFFDRPSLLYVPGRS